MLLVSPALAAVAIGLLLVWTMRYRAGAPAASREPVAA